MTTPSFKADDNSAGGNGAGTTNFQAAGGTTDDSGAQDTTVLLEVGGRKFTKTDLIKKITNADQHIGTLESKLDEQGKLLGEVNEVLKKQVNAAELLKQIKDGQANQNGSQQQPNAGAQQPAPLTLDDVLKEVEKVQASKASVAQQESNWKEVTGTLTKAFGDATNQKVQAACKEAGIELAQAVALAKSSPKVFLRLFPDLTAKPQPSVLMERGKVNTQSVKDSVGTSSGFNKATNTKQEVSIYLNRLKELGLS